MSSKTTKAALISRAVLPKRIAPSEKLKPSKGFFEAVTQTDRKVPEPVAQELAEPQLAILMPPPVSRGLFARTDEFSGRFFRPFFQSRDDPIYSDFPNAESRTKLQKIYSEGGCAGFSFDWIMSILHGSSITDNTHYKIHIVQKFIYVVQIFCRLYNCNLSFLLQKFFHMTKIMQSHLMLINRENTIQFISFKGETDNHVVAMDFHDGQIKLFDTIKGECHFSDFERFKIWFDLYQETYVKKGYKIKEITCLEYPAPEHLLSSAMIAAPPIAELPANYYENKKLLHILEHLTIAIRAENL